MKRQEKEQIEELIRNPQKFIRGMGARDLLQNDQNLTIDKYIKQDDEFPKE